MNASARTRFSSVAGRGRSQSIRVEPAKVMRLKVSFCRMESIALVITSLAFSMGNPRMEPEVSSTKTISRGRTSSAGVLFGGESTIVRYPPGTASSSFPGMTWLNTLSVIASSSSRQRSTKSRLGIVFRSAKLTRTLPLPSRFSTTS